MNSFVVLRQDAIKSNIIKFSNFARKFTVWFDSNSIIQLHLYLFDMIKRYVNIKKVRPGWLMLIEGSWRFAYGGFSWDR